MPQGMVFWTEGQACRDVNGEHAFIIHPESAFSLYWSLLMSFLIFYATLMVPVRISFDIGTSKTSPALWIDLFVDVLFAIDMYIQTRTAIKKPGNLDEYEFRRAVILRRYLRTWFIVDLVAAVPFDLVFVFGKDTKAEEANLLFTKLLKALRFMRVAKLIKVSKLRQLVSGMEDRLGIFDINPGIRRLAETAVLTFVVSHLTACLWYFVSSTAREANEGSWIESYQDDYGTQDNGSLYLTSLYWSVSTLTSVGFGDIKPANNAERFVATLACWAGATVFGYVIGQMSSMVADLNQISFQYHRKMDSINAYLKYRKVPPQLQKRIRRFFRYYIGRKMLFDESQILNELTHGLKVELSMFLTKDVLRNIHIFKDIKNPSFMSAIVTMLKPFSAAPGDFVIREGDLALEMYLIVRGTVEVLASNGLVYTRLSQGSHFGEITYLDSDVEERRAASVRALTYCDLFSFSKSDVAEVSRNFPEVLKMMHEITERRKTIAKNLRTQRKARKVTTGSKENHFHMIPDNPTGSIPTARPPETPESQQETARVTRRRASIGAMPTVPSIDIGSVSRTSSMTGDTVARIAPLLRLNSPEPLSPSTSSIGATNAPLSPGIMTLDNTGSVGSYSSYVAAVQGDASYPANSVQFATFSSAHGESSLASDILALKSLLTAQAKELATLTEAINTSAMEDEKRNGRAGPKDADKRVDGTTSG
ncbi:Potassium voltage-gated channel protein eag [Hondaea fermentalgiana]|uniref:Potassium voltage-gated channel protein eag n=1 Tax=Hondaea fermentalgiana TaxID=2315210 RepID=A0A2R5GKX4_9STRA|nr:Potassium voltage-gated channel protein eag [Hondaea fermentalgiana]|eukprot:GBG31530.1 Potassium voltage-gated channel protein eag [Hondaea fermentalgiana]